MTRCYSELSKLQTFDERFRYLQLNGQVGHDTFGYDRYLNQFFYTSPEWRALRDYVIIRDNGCDLGLDGYTIYDKIFIHHMNPITKEDIEKRSDNLLKPEFLVCVSFDTHNAIHYGGELYLDKFKVIERTPNDQAPWKRS